MMTMRMLCLCLSLALCAPYAVRPRTVPICPGHTATIFELAQPGELVRSWMEGTNKGADPFGVVMWPGATLTARLLVQHREEVCGKRVLCLGAGTGLEAITAAQLGAECVIALDINPLSLSLLKDAAHSIGAGSTVDVRLFDLCDETSALPGPIDVLVCSDLLYDERLAETIGRRVAEALGSQAEEVPLWLVMTDSQRFRHTGAGLAAGVACVESGAPLKVLPEWQETTLRQVTTNGILVEEDVCSDVTARYISAAFTKADGVEAIGGCVQVSPRSLQSLD